MSARSSERNMAINSPDQEEERCAAVSFPSSIAIELASKSMTGDFVEAREKAKAPEKRLTRASRADIYSRLFRAGGVFRKRFYTGIAKVVQEMSRNRTALTLSATIDRIRSSRC